MVRSMLGCDLALIKVLSVESGRGAASGPRRYAKCGATAQSGAVNRPWAAKHAVFMARRAARGAGEYFMQSGLHARIYPHLAISAKMGLSGLFIGFCAYEIVFKSVKATVTHQKSRRQHFFSEPQTRV
jgi:hypothetical protein